LAISVVFSYWTKTLCLIQRELDVASIAYVRLDGSMPKKTRDKAISEFQSNLQIAVFLISLSCGGDG
jgi:SWI/SNF-related matrix-associated actin-dependent regulator of chromatin subfamily A3